ncbi:MAG: hypothetical protein R2860_07730 [Desulfobacterales bacterium]
MEATLLSGLDAPTTTTGNSDHAGLARIKELAILPNKVGDLKGCFVLAEGKGNLASERVEVRLVTLSCVSKKGQSVIDQTVKSYVVDEDGKPGFGALYLPKWGPCWPGALAGFLGAWRGGPELFHGFSDHAPGRPDPDLERYRHQKHGQRRNRRRHCKSAEQLEKFYLQLAKADPAHYSGGGNQNRDCGHQ